MASPLLDASYNEGDDATMPAALPDSSLDFLVKLAQTMQASTVFEFGSGRSTETFLRHGLQVTSLEDTAHWMEQTVARLTPEDRHRHTALVRSLKVRLHGGFPVKDWGVDPEIAAPLKNADLVLVDSPFYVPFRESTLWSALNHCDGAVIVLDDTRIPTLARFCDRIARANPGLLHRRVRVGHTFDLFARVDEAPLTLGLGIGDLAKGWRRFFMARTTF